MDIFDLIEKEKVRQESTLMMIPSENYAYDDVHKAEASVLSHKYAEGYPGKRYYNGNEIIDQIETIAQETAKKLFGVPYANVQSYSGSPANSAVLMGLLDPEDTIMGLALSGGGHLTHGHPNITFSGKFFKSVQFGVKTDGYIDYNDLLKKAKDEKPKLIIVGTTSYPRKLEWSYFREAADICGAYLVADISHIAGLIVANLHESPVAYADVVTTTTHKMLRGPRGAIIMVTERGIKKDPEIAKKIDRGVFPGMQGGPHMNTIAAIAIAITRANSKEYREYAKKVIENSKVLADELINCGFNLVTGGTDNHLMVIDLKESEMKGKEFANLLEEVGIVVNANSVPYDPAPPGNPSGVRIGTPAITARGMGKIEMKKIAQVMKKLYEGVDIAKLKEEVSELTKKFPLLKD